jgi:hypothetical protein
LPVEANKPARDFARQYQDASLMAAIDHAERKRAYGEVTHLGKDSRPEAIFNFTRGLCVRVNPITWIDARNVLKESIKFYE